MDKLNMGIDPLFHLAYSRRRHFKRDHRIYRDHWENAGKNHHVYPFPIHLDLEVTTDCQLRCKHCMRAQLHLGRQYMNIRDWIKYLDEANQYSCFASVKPNYRGEPTLHKQLPLMLQFAREKGTLDILMNTNGIFPQRLVNELAPYIDEVAFSIDATTQKTHSIVRPYTKAGLKRIISNVDGFLELRDTAFPNLRIRVAFVRQQKNAHEAEEFVRFWKARKVDKIVLNECYIPGQRGDNRAVVKWVQRDDFVCQQLYQRLAITSGGEVLPCCGAYDEELSLGNIKKEGKRIVDYWNSDRLNNIRSLHESGQYRTIETCRNCALSFRPEVIK